MKKQMFGYVYRSDYRKKFLDQVIRIWLKTEKNYHLFLDTSSKMKMDDLTMTFPSRPQAGCQMC